MPRVPAGGLLRSRLQEQSWELGIGFGVWKKKNCLQPTPVLSRGSSSPRHLRIELVDDTFEPQDGKEPGGERWSRGKGRVSHSTCTAGAQLSSVSCSEALKTASGFYCSLGR